MTAMTEAGIISAEKAAIDRGRAIWLRAGQAEWPEGDRKVIRRTHTDLGKALDLYDAIEAEDIHPASEWPELEDDPDAFDAALRKASEDVTGWADELVRVLPATADDGGMQ